MSGAPSTVDEQLRQQSLMCAAMGSRFYGRVLDAAARDYRDGGPLRAFFDADSRRRNAPRAGLRLMGALQCRALDGSAPGLAAHFPSCGGDGDAGAAWDEARALFESEAESFAALYERTPQTNEVARATPLLAGLLAIADAAPLPVRLFDVGTSAGLNLRLDRFRYEGRDWSWGDPASPLVLREQTQSGRPRHLAARLQIVKRAGCDVHPLDVTIERDRVELRSFVWADQPERFARLHAATIVARALPAELEAADFFEWIPRRVVPTRGMTTVVMHSVVTEHLAPAERERLQGTIEAACSAATQAAPMAWLRMEPNAGNRYETRVTAWPSRAETLIAVSDGHAQSIDWTGA